ncbi:hypothetical protein C491_20107 [Natronococcus amylolyticus DSM 10524]|uniref:Uncharacterized protein n=1 Tax=Natronococcus amylolyticus DSM 10524 TaxID=1227497 RepID=L9X0K9_9EURY|nr:hypothetical protein [Natronococcus amylolyticus]ELY54133.1 hypothetical protein C491_20107 [Natronococcus amylolyticus DSM 10524]
MSTTSARINPSVSRLRLGAFVVLGVGFLALAVPGFAEPLTFWTGIVFGGYAYPTHELHHFVLGGFFVILLLGVFVQAVRPSARVGALHAAIVMWVSLTVVYAVGGEFSSIFLVLLALLVGMALAHPAGRDQLPSTDRFDRRLAAIAGVTAVGGLAFAGVELAAHFGTGDAHAGFGHYLIMASAAVSAGALSLYASLRGVGWRFPVYAAAALMALVGLGSIAYPGAEQGSSLGVGLGAALVLWTALFLLVAERGATRNASDRDAAIAEGSGSSR